MANEQSPQMRRTQGRSSPGSAISCATPTDEHTRLRREVECRLDAIQSHAGYALLGLEDPTQALTAVSRLAAMAEMFAKAGA